MLQPRNLSRRTFLPSFQVTGLNEGYSYFFRVKAENKYGIGLPVETTEPTLAADPIDRPTEPRDLEVTAVTNNSVSLKWVKPTYDGGSPLTTYLVERCRLGESDHTRINTDDLLETEYTATGLNPGAKYEFRVKARNIRYIGPPSSLFELQRGIRSCYFSCGMNYWHKKIRQTNLI
ncbi:myomesin-1-like [Branchiostoma floridae x Branchiostoma belcheri]